MTATTAADDVGHTTDVYCDWLPLLCNGKEEVKHQHHLMCVCCVCVCYVRVCVCVVLDLVVIPQYCFLVQLKTVVP